LNQWINLFQEGDLSIVPFDFYFGKPMVEFSEQNISAISKFLGTEPEKNENSWCWKLVDPETKNFLFLTIYQNIELNGSKINLASVQTSFGYFELHNFSKIILVEPNEIAFLQYDTQKLNCLIVGKNCTCSLYSNIQREIIKHNFAELDSALLLSALQLALFEETLS